MNGGRFRYRYGRNRLPKESRTIPVKGYGDDEEGKYFRCWNCNMICNVDENSLGDRDSTDGTVLIDHAIPAVGRIADGRGIERSRWTVSPVADADGNPRTVSYYYDVNGKGCPFCHTQNWRGDHP